MDERQSHRRVVIIKDGAKWPASFCASYMRHKMISAFVSRRDNLQSVYSVVYLFTYSTHQQPQLPSCPHNWRLTVYRLFLSHPSRSLMNL